MKKTYQHKFWRNEFLDLIYYDHPTHSLGSWLISMDGNYITSKGGLNQAKSFVNKKRDLKTKWVKF